MRRTILVVLLIVLIAAHVAIAQEKSKDIIATTEDGRRVLLKADGTWEFLKGETAKNIPALKEIKTWKGQGIKKTESFEISTDEWRIAWIVRGESYGIFMVTAQKEGAVLPDIAASVTGNSADYTTMHGKGKYWLEINSSQTWAIVVYEIVK